MRINHNILQPFTCHEGMQLRNDLNRPSTLAHRIVYAVAKDKGVDIYYLDNGDRPQMMVAHSLKTLAQLQRLHGDGFVLINRNTLVNTVALTGVFLVDVKKVPKGYLRTYGASVLGWPDVVLPVSRRSSNLVRAAFESVN